MTAKKPEDANPSDNVPENSASTDEQSPEAIAAAAIDAAKAQANGADNATSESENSESETPDASVSADEASANESSDDSNSADDPLGFDDARMPDSDDNVVDLSAAAAAAAADGDETDDLAAQLAAANAKTDEHWNRILRMQADLENERKRAQKQVANAHKFAIEGFVNELLPIKDSLEMGLEAAKADDADLIKIVEGSELTLKLLIQAFEKNHISEVDPLDQKFDPNVHQAMSMQEVEGKEPNTVIGVMQKGYTLNERLIRPALVTVSK